DLGGVRPAQRAPEDREVLREDVDEPPVDAAVPRDDAVAEDLLLGHAEVRRAMGHEAIELHEAARIEQLVDALPRRELAPRVLLGDARLSAARQSPLVELPEPRAGVARFRGPTRHPVECTAAAPRDRARTGAAVVSSPRAATDVRGSEPRWQPFSSKAIPCRPTATCPRSAPRLPISRSSPRISPTRPSRTSPARS